MKEVTAEKLYNQRLKEKGVIIEEKYLRKYGNYESIGYRYSDKRKMIKL